LQSCPAQTSVGIICSSRATPLHQQPWRRGRGPVAAAAAPLPPPAASPAASQTPPHYAAPGARPFLPQYLDFELLWLRARARHKLSRAAAEWVLEDVRAGALPCDAPLMEARLEGMLALGRRLPGADTRHVVNRHRLGLRHDPRWAAGGCR
jgi:hypothetical protein